MFFFQIVGLEMVGVTHVQPNKKCVSNINMFRKKQNTMEVTIKARVGGWVFNPSEKYARQIGNHFPK